MKLGSDLDSWLSIIAERHTSTIMLGLERVAIIAEQLQLVHFDCPVITVAGTNGKGTTVALLQNLYTNAGYRVGSYYSPHLHHFTERVQVNNQPVDEAELCAAFEIISEAAFEVPLTFFEFITLAALLIFKKQALDIIILEVGLGGRLDAVNIVENDVAIVTQIALDHCDRLGNDRESIGYEKAGIFREKKIAICADPFPPQSLLDRAQQLECLFFAVGQHFYFEQNEYTWSWWLSTIDHSSVVRTECHAPVFARAAHALPLPKVPLTSAACALMCSHLLAQRLPISQEHCLKAVKNTTLPGRYQVIADRCPIIFDVAHNGAAAILLAKKLSEIKNTGKTYAIFSVLADKDCEALIAPLGKMIDEWHVIPLSVARAAKSTDIVQQIKALYNEPCYNHSDLTSMWTLLREKLLPQDRVVVYGSFYTVAAVQNVMLKAQLEKE